MLETLSRVRGRIREWNRTRYRLPAWMCVLIIVVLALAVEVLGFNFRHWQSLGYEEVVLRDTPIRVTQEGYSLGFSSLDVDAKNVKIEIAGEERDSSVWVQLAVTDEGNSTSYYLPVVEEHAQNARSQVHTIFTYGSLKSLRVTFPGDVYGDVDGNTLIANNEFPITVTKISLNAQVPFTFSFLRFFLLAGIMLFVWGLRPGGACSRIRALDRSWPARLVRGGVLAGALVVACVFLFSFPKWANVATSFYNEENYSASRGMPYTVFDQPDTATNEYAKLAQAFAAGQLNLIQTPPDWLKEMDDPYDAGARDEESAHHLRGYLWDTAYYDGNYYVYFGVLPVLVFYLPYYLITGTTFPNSMGVLICSLAFIVGVYSLLRALIRWRFTKSSLSTFVLVFLGILFASGLLFGLARPGLYNVPVTMARALCVWGLCLWYRGWKGASPVRLAGGSALVALIAATRPQLLIVAPLVFVLLVMTVRADMPRARKGGWIACLLVPFVLVAAGVMWYNAARFSSPFDFGANYNLTFNNMTMRGSSKLRALEGAFYYLLCPPIVNSNFPFLKLTDCFPTFPGTTTYEPLMGGLMLLEPMLLAVVFLGGLRRSHGGARADKPVFWMAGYFLAAAVILVLFDTEGAGVLLRYMQDFGFLLSLSAALVFLHHLGGAGCVEPAFGFAASSDAEPAGVPEAARERRGLVAAAGAHAVSPVDADICAMPAEGASAAPVADVPAHAAKPEAAADVPAAPAKRRHSAWEIALFVCVALGLLTAILIGLLEHDPTGDLSTGGAYPLDWENLRQTFMWWL